MAITDFRITDADVSGKGVVAAPDQLNGTATENKRIFDRLIREVVKEEHNGLIDALEALGVQQLVQYGTENIRHIRLNADEHIEVSADGKMWTEVTSSGHIATAEVAGVVKPSADFDIAEDGTLSLYKALALFSTVVPAEVEKGATQTTATVEWATNKTPTSVTVEGESVSPDTTSKELTGLQITAEKEFTVVAADSRGSQTATAVMRFCNGVYTGAAAAPAAVDGAFIRTLTKTLQSYKARTFTVNAAAGRYIWYACPAGYGTPVFNVGGFDGGFSKVSTLNYTNPSGYTESYQVWRSDNAGLGQTTVKVS